MSLKQARDRRDAARKLVAAGSDPSAERKAERAAQADTFEALAREWLEAQSHSLDARTSGKKLERFENFVFPYLGREPIAQITTQDVLAVLKRIEARGKHDAFHEFVPVRPKAAWTTSLAGAQLPPPAIT